ncbi:MAG: hypothetical protein A2600_11735 [Candidatus Lambdaproteobacteria bacterium RIFOXYD1_FULL_56_27]|uniref:Lcl C-terminal domain-containing protein n=1 Tax=Candidatus Lambdaproteobacteria bacterium RIFOXYD2_FULL_56_26 TaxID=1817773 RepID=A0A1F6GX73_9PROT|nr:MAG: hypothetical protein A2426_12070 [Candidatus Lambdaproteobacteria bacterium RIFOXYC1_FULL_56_13]OGH02773.1 MAG: hypothetical protein A2557_02855 [Candidatus Lambdaproteobacteria bacterium RIFOXYD2_FULL_56_26]OGH08015.1 MAG: hypothetical protein A2600_11735 [Candidatus Lambdaproteobacteria bacterium RIFOXYD1_FULL_56_27]
MEAQKKRFLDNGNQTVTDLSTGLTWDQREPKYMKWQSAVDYAKESNHGGYNDWRLPTLEELMGLLDRSQLKAPLLDLRFFPGVEANHYWTSETEVMPTGTAAKYVSFNRGGTGRRNIVQKNCVRLVR